MRNKLFHMKTTRESFPGWFDFLIRNIIADGFFEKRHPANVPAGGPKAGFQRSQHGPGKRPARRSETNWSGSARGRIGILLR